MQDITKDLIYPLFVKDGKNLREKIKSMPGIYRFSPDTLIKEARELVKLGIRAVLIFGLTKEKDNAGSAAYEENNIVARAVKALKANFPDLIVMTDICLCAYTSHGHCGILKSPRRQVTRSQVKIDNKKTLELLSKMALSHARAGADYVAPSAMAKNQVLAIREALDKNGFRNTKIMGYSAKYASNFYGPFREAADSTPAFGDRRAYQLDFANRTSAIEEIKADIKEGADIVMIKPALGYLDVIKEARDRFYRPLAAYNVSGEYTMVKAYCKSTEYRTQSTELERKLVMEILTGIKRAGADLIITYHAKDIAKWLKKRKIR
ncbi:MAG: porphobilinogen synthase [Candidatus Omnitrophica bacterium]|nr:porphobilinogen synthase [Candidatus Omnitrophota bacterium]